MQTKILEIRDEGTFISVLCIDIQPDNEPQRYHMRRCGYSCDGHPNVVMTKLSADHNPATNDPYQWKGDTRTFPRAHLYIIENWSSLNDGDVIDVQFILGETSSPKISERFERLGR